MVRITRKNGSDNWKETFPGSPDPTHPTPVHHSSSLHSHQRNLQQRYLLWQGLLDQGLDCSFKMRTFPETGISGVQNKKLYQLGQGEGGRGGMGLTESHRGSPPLYCLHYTLTQYTFCVTGLKRLSLIMIISLKFTAIGPHNLMFRFFSTYHRNFGLAHSNAIQLFR